MFYCFCVRLYRIWHVSENSAPVGAKVLRILLQTLEAANQIAISLVFVQRLNDVQGLLTERVYTLGLYRGCCADAGSQGRRTQNHTNVDCHHLPPGSLLVSDQHGPRLVGEGSQQCTPPPGPQQSSGRTASLVQICSQPKTVLRNRSPRQPHKGPASAAGK